MSQSNNSHHVDVLVLGTGPAGISTAIGLRQKGLTVAIMGKLSDQSFKVGESLSPDAVQVLRDIGVNTNFLSQYHQACLGNKSAWGKAHLHYTDFINHPQGKGWHLNRTLFEQQLIAHAQSIGVYFFQNSILKSFERVENTWYFQSRNSNEGYANFLVDASGRNAWLCRRLGIERIVEDQQMALVAWLQVDHSSSDPFSLVEAQSDGWWYSALLPQKKMVALFMTSATNRDLPDNTLWQLRLDQSHHTQNRFLACNAQLITSPQWIDASSGYLPQVHGESWLAVGDAAFCYDPIAAHGITMALTAGRDAAIAIHSALNGQQEALRNYEERLKKAFAQYAFDRGRLYVQGWERFGSHYWKDRVMAAHHFLEQQGVWEGEV